jgi:aminoglycoside phosphotransferase family enzyme
VLSVNGRGRVVDWLVTMRRLPAELMLDHAIRAGAAAPDRLLAVGRTLADFYARQKPARVRPRDYVRGLIGQIQKDCAELALGASIRADVAAIGATLQAAAPRLEAALTERVLAGRVVEGHGDLRPEHICLSDPPRIIDCLEFSRRLRTLDAAEELAFFAVECECLGAEWAAERVIDGYAERAGDAIPGPVFDFFRSRRALVRAKLLARRWRTDDAAASKRWSDRTQMYLALAQRYATRALEHAGAPACPGSSGLALIERPAL